MGPLTDEDNRGDELQGTIDIIVRIGAREFSETFKATLKPPHGHSLVVVIKFIRYPAILLAGIKDPQKKATESVRIRQEIRRMVVIRHPNIAPFLGYRMNPEKGEPSLITLYYVNGNIANYLKNHPSAAPTHFLVDAATGLAFLHTQTPPIIHGALRPTNVLIDSSYPPRAMLTDYGQADDIATARFGLTTGNEDGKLVGYSSPDYVETGENTVQSDVFAFGALVLHILSGQPPMYKLQYVAAMRAISKGEIASPIDHPILPSDSPFWPIMRRCWAFDASSRPTMGDITNMLSALLPDPPVSVLRSIVAGLLSLVSKVFGFDAIHPSAVVK